MLAVLLFTPDQYLVEFGAVLAGSLWLAVVGYIDDRQGMNPRIKMAAQIIAGLVVMLAGIRVRLFDLHILNYLLTLFWIVGITNAINLMDNMDGLAAGFAAIAAGTFCVLAASQELILVASLSAALCGATLGFLRYNFNPATTFMGDTGSLVIGFVLAVLGIKLNFPAQTKLVTWSIPLMVLAIPIFDTTLVTFTRLREKRPITQGGKDHTSHRLVRMGYSHRSAVLILYGAGIILGSIALAISQAAPKIAAGLIGLVSIIALSAFVTLEWSYMHAHE
jgi:UDP-GlcNAc:undecaprenyl-phosphate GlcNAc-1-phosphate transferase